MYSKSSNNPEKTLSILDKYPELIIRSLLFSDLFFKLCDPKINYFLVIAYIAARKYRQIHSTILKKREKESCLPIYYCFKFKIKNIYSIFFKTSKLFSSLRNEIFERSINKKTIQETIQDPRQVIKFLFTRETTFFKILRFL